MGQGSERKCKVALAEGHLSWDLRGVQELTRRRERWQSVYAGVVGGEAHGPLCIVGGRVKCTRD